VQKSPLWSFLFQDFGQAIFICPPWMPIAPLVCHEQRPHFLLWDLDSYITRAFSEDLFHSCRDHGVFSVSAVDDSVLPLVSDLNVPGRLFGLMDYHHRRGGTASFLCFRLPFTTLLKSVVPAAPLPELSCLLPISPRHENCPTFPGCCSVFFFCCFFWGFLFPWS